MSASISLEAPIKRVATYDTPLPFAPIMERRSCHPSSVSYRWRDPFAHDGRSHVPQEVRMPALGQTSDELRILLWRKREGERVTIGEPLLGGGDR